MNSNVGGDVVTFDSGGTTATPLAGEVEVVGALTTDMALADVFLVFVSNYSRQRVSVDDNKIDVSVLMGLHGLTYIE